MPVESSTSSRDDVLSAVDYLAIQVPSAPELRAAGILTDAELDSKKALIMGG